MAGAGNDYTIYVELEDGTTNPANEEDLEWMEKPYANRVFDRGVAAREQVANSPVRAIKMVLVDGTVIRSKTFRN